MALVTSLGAPLSPERTSVFLLTLDLAGDGMSLPPTELERAEAEAVAPGRRDAVLARRRLLRRAVALRLGLAPGDVVIAKDAQGAPRVTSAREPIFVSLASRAKVVAIAVSDRPVGVDVELIETILPEPAWNVLHPSERAWLGRRSADEQAESFLALWCAKEAYFKAIGLGLRREAAEIAVDLEHRERLQIEDRGQPGRLDEAFVTRTEAHDTCAMLACIVLAR